jgi:hypothetical protein
MKDSSNPDDLPADVLEGATVRGNEYGWVPTSFPIALARAEAHGFACLGGQFQFRLRDGSTCEMYWLHADSTDRMPEESWRAYCHRSCSEVLKTFQRLILETDFAKEAASWSFQNDPLKDLIFVSYFVTEADLARLARMELS